MLTGAPVGAETGRETTREISEHGSRKSGLLIKTKGGTVFNGSIDDICPEGAIV